MQIAGHFNTIFYHSMYAFSCAILPVKFSVLSVILLARLTQPRLPYILPYTQPVPVPPYSPSSYLSFYDFYPPLVRICIHVREAVYGFNGTPISSPYDVTLVNSSFKMNVLGARRFCPDLIFYPLIVYCSCGLLSWALGSEDTYVDLSNWFVFPDALCQVLLSSI